MSENKEENELSHWMSTYGLVTAERILERYKLRLRQDELFSAMKNPNSFYHRILKIPLKNIFNGIILQQAYDYQIYAQKIFIDYLMSGESSKSEEAPGGHTREEIETERKNLVDMADRFREEEVNHNKLIAESQKALIIKVQEWLRLLSSSVSAINLNLKSLSINKNEDLIKNFNALLVHPAITDQTKINLKGEVWTRIETLYEESLTTQIKQMLVDEIIKLKDFNTELDNDLADFTSKVKAMSLRFRSWRSDFYALILRVNDLLKLLPEFQSDQAQTEENKESLYFDSGIGENED